MFEPLNFSSLNETDIREEVLAPLIRLLGYRSGTEHDVIREQSLRYPRIFLGRKNAKKDPILRGKADYILEAACKVRWVIEAKPPTQPIGQDDVEQAYTYANHPEVRAVYFVLSNGRTLQVYQTNRGPDVAPIFAIDYEEINGKEQQLLNLLAPHAMLRDHPEVQPDTGIPLGPGLRSLERIANGSIQYHKCSLPNVPALNELQITIIGGAVERDESGRIIAFLKTMGPSRSMQEMSERLGMNEFEMICEDHEISIDRNKPSAFRYQRTMVFPAGEPITDINTWEQRTFPFNLAVSMDAQAIGILDGHLFTGKFLNHATYKDVNLQVLFEGEFKIFLA